MLRTGLLMTLFLLVVESTEAQSYSTCDTVYNTFWSSMSIASVSARVDTVFPNGIIYFKRDLSPDLQVILDLINLDTNITFAPIKEIESVIDTSIAFIRFQQFYKGIEVEGGGYTEGYHIATNGPWGGGGRCLEAFKALPYILSNIDLDVNEALSINEISDSLGIVPVDSTNLFVSFNIDRGCTYSLVYSLDYIDLDSNLRRIIVDAIEVSVIDTLPLLDSGLEAPTRHYGDQEMDDSPFDATYRWLVSEDSRLVTYDYQQWRWENNLYWEVVENETEPTNQYIPKTANLTEWPQGSASNT